MEELFVLYQVKVFRFVLRLLNDKGLAEDVTAETFCQVWSHAAASFRGDAQALTWLLTIARYQAISTRRRRSHREVDEAAAESIEDLADNPEVAAAKRQQGAIVARCLNSLLSEHRDPIAFFYFQGKSVNEVAELVGIPRSTVKTRMLRGRKLMGELLKHFDISSADGTPSMSPAMPAPVLEGG